MTDEHISSLRAMAHPLRIRMLSLLTGAELSAAEVARELGISHAERVVPPARPPRCRRDRRGGRGDHPGRHRQALPLPPRRRRSAAVRSAAGGRERTRVAYLKAVHSDVERRAMAGSPTVPMSHFDLDGWVPPEVG